MAVAGIGMDGRLLLPSGTRAANKTPRVFLYYYSISPRINKEKKSKTLAFF
jgi:hypothetical protein